MRVWQRALVVALWAVASGNLAPWSARASDMVSLDDLSQIHAIAVDKTGADRLYFATHSGLFLGTPSGIALNLSDDSNDLVGFVADPTDPRVFYASGHAAQGGKLGVIRTDDGGKTWSQWSKGADGPVDFHTMDVSKADPNVIYGFDKAIQISRDAGRSWKIMGRPPAEMFDIAASARDAETVYAATRNGLFRSRDGGRTWADAYMAQLPVTMIHASVDGTLYAFVYGAGLMATSEPTLAWRTVSSDFLDRFLLDMAVDPHDPAHLYAIADTGAVMTSKDGGKTWGTFQGSDSRTAEVVARGRQLFEEDCQPCHGVRGVGENPSDMYAKDEYGFIAPPLDNSSHGWHHTDAGIMDTILNGSPRNERMSAWRETLSRDDARAVIAYIKSLWNFRSLACQGTRHMECM
ncbi:MAG: c-type cytochrome [Kiloniellaceae bacterium]